MGSQSSVLHEGKLVVLPIEFKYVVLGVWGLGFFSLRFFPLQRGMLAYRPDHK